VLIAGSYEDNFAAKAYSVVVISAIVNASVGVTRQASGAYTTRID
jgi:hypothetical protein